MIFFFFIVDMFEYDVYNFDKKKMYLYLYIYKKNR